jgi:uncharacterized protein (DUF2235 family)
MPKNIVICCDGTNNQFAGYHTNVLRTYKVSRRHATQVTYYDPGVGTMPEPWSSTNLEKRWDMLKGLAYADGLIDNISDAYRFLMANYEQGDKVFLFGFSRGAYTARAVAAIAHSIGLLFPGTDNLLPYAIEYWQKDFGPKSPGGAICAEFKASLARQCPIHFVGVWDTVSSVGYINSFRTLPFTTHNPEVAHFRHAVSVDERRSTFRQNLMGPLLPNQDIRNVYFAGVHSDVGGGYVPSEAGLAKIAFDWMMREAMAAGLDVDTAALSYELNQNGPPPDPRAPIHASLKSFWWVGEILPIKRFSYDDNRWHWHWLGGAFNQPRDILRWGPKPYVALHNSVLERLKLVPEYRPINLPHDEATLRSQFHIEI